jgi:hypothetical protein
VAPASADRLQPSSSSVGYANAHDEGTTGLRVGMFHSFLYWPVKNKKKQSLIYFSANISS